MRVAHTAPLGAGRGSKYCNICQRASSFGPPPTLYSEGQKSPKGAILASLPFGARLPQRGPLAYIGQRKAIYRVEGGIYTNPRKAPLGPFWAYIARKSPFGDPPKRPLWQYMPKGPSLLPLRAALLVAPKRQEQSGTPALPTLWDAAYKAPTFLALSGFPFGHILRCPKGATKRGFV